MSASVTSKAQSISSGLVTFTVTMWSWNPLIPWIGKVTTTCGLTWRIVADHGLDAPWVERFQLAVRQPSTRISASSSVALTFCISEWRAAPICSRVQPNL